MQLADTNAVSELMRPRPQPSVTAWAEAQERIALSVITIEELRFGLTLRPSAQLERWLARFVAARVEVLPIDQRIVERAGDLRARLRLAGHTRTQADMLIAATAAHHGLTLVTRNTRDFAGCGLRLLDPWTAK